MLWQLLDDRGRQLLKRVVSVLVTGLLSAYVAQSSGAESCVDACQLGDLLRSKECRLSRVLLSILAQPHSDINNAPRNESRCRSFLNRLYPLIDQ